MPDESDPLTPPASTPPPGFSGPVSSVASAVPAGSRVATDRAPTVQLAPDTVVGLAAMLLIVCGSFGPWATVAGISVSALGNGGNAMYTLIAGVVLLIPVARNRFPALAVGAGLTAVVIAYRQGSDLLSVGDGIVQIGWGLYATGVGGLVGLGFGLRRVKAAIGE